MRSKVLVLALGLALVPTRAGAQAVGVAHALVKVRPDFAVPASTEARIEAARNEVEPFQIVIGGAATGVRASVGALSGPSGASIAGSNVVLYREGLYSVVTASSLDGDVGAWPDPLIPDVDTYVGETRNAFPFDVPAGEARAIWVDVFVPPGTPPGEYRGTIAVTGTGLSADVTVVLRVRAFELPSTASLRSAFGMGWDAACRAHRGSYAACGGDAGVEAFHVLYARGALEHRMSIESVVYAPPVSAADWTHFDAMYGPLLSGTAGTRLSGAQLTTIRMAARDAAQMLQWRAHFDGHPDWTALLFDYTCDEPPAGCVFSEIPTRGAGPRAAMVPVLVTTDIDEATTNGVVDDIDVMVPIVNFMDDRGGTNRRADYDGFVARGDTHLWMYQSCMSHGCGDGCAPTADPYFTGWPSYMIDASAVQNRAMEWLSFRYDVSGELYFETTYDLVTAWDDQCDFSGNGDGTLFYPGTPARIGGTTDIPVESIRMKLIREGMEDYEYLRLLAMLGDPALADAEASALFPTPYSAGAVTGDALYAARSRIADRIEELLGSPPMRPEARIRRTAAAPVVDGTTSEFAAEPGLRITIAGGATASVRMLWDDVALYVGAEIEDVDLAAPETGRDGELYLSDGIELLLDPAHDRSSAPDGDDRHVVVTVAGDLLDARGAGATEDRSVDLGVTAARTTMGTLGDGPGDVGYSIEFAIPWAGIGIVPAVGARLGGDVALNDARVGAPAATADWAGLTSYAEPSRWNDLVLASGSGEVPDAGIGSDGGSMDAGPALDGGARAVATTACGCRASSPARPSLAFLLSTFALALAGQRRRTGRRR